MTSIEFETPFVDISYETYDCGFKPRSLLELKVLQIMGEIKRKDDWTKKVFNNDILNKWRNELKNINIFHDKKIKPSIINYIFDELQFHASNANSVQIAAVDGVYESINVIPKELKNRLETGLKVFEKDEDWHPGSDNQVLDLIHPSLYCYVYGKSVELPENIKINMNDWWKYIRIGDVDEKDDNLTSPNKDYRIKTVKKSYSGEDEYYYSKKYQWLPCDIKVDNNYNVSIESYINNVHPIKHKDLYKTLEDILKYFIPLFENVLTDHLIQPIIRYDAEIDWYEDMEPHESDFEEEEEYDDAMDDYWENRVPSIPIRMEKFVPPSIKHKIDLKGSNLQVIVKAANIILTPEKPVYPGGVWHVEGMKNESIVATGIYYYRCENITDSTLSFRTFVKDPLYEQNDFSGIEYVYGIVNEEPDLNQKIGYVDCKEGRCIAFPNIHQHRVSPFELEDKNKPGFRKILVFFLIDPTKKVKSTSMVLPQQRNWYLHELLNLEEFKSLPPELVDIIVSKTNSMSLNEAKGFRAELMKERKYFVDENNKNVFERMVNLCEH